MRSPRERPNFHCHEKCISWRRHWPGWLETDTVHRLSHFLFSAGKIDSICLQILAISDRSSVSSIISKQIDYLGEKIITVILWYLLGKQFSHGSCLYCNHLVRKKCYRNVFMSYNNTQLELLYYVIVCSEGNNRNFL